MHAFGEALETFYLVPLIYLLWPVLFNLASRFFAQGTVALHPTSRNLSD
jgi:hypothetical protein